MLMMTVFSEPYFDCREAASVAANEGTGGGACDSEPVNYSVSPTQPHALLSCNPESNCQLQHCSRRLT